MSQWCMMSFQDAASPVMYMLNKFHDKIMVIIMFIVAYVFMLMLYIMKGSTVFQGENVAHELELAWTLYPAIVLGGIALPSLRILYLLDDLGYPQFSVKIMGHQWYWSYSFSNLEYDSYMISEEDLSLGSSRLLEVDNRLILPMEMDLRLLVSSADVLHSWTVPSLGIKVDAVPGRLNQYSMAILSPGLYYGQCSEICGANHSFMPICVESIHYKDFPGV